MKQYRLAVVAVALLAGCAGSQEAYRPDSVLGRVIAREAPADAETASGATVFPVLIGTVMLPLPFNAPGASSRQFMYTIRDEAGRVYRARSIRAYEVGDCAKLWFAAPAGDGPPAEGSVLAGTLELSRDCKK